MTPIEILALLFAVLILVKMTFITFAPKKWMKFADKVLKKAHIFTWVYLFAAILIGFYIFQVFTIVDVAAIAMLIALLYGVTLMPYAEELYKVAHKKLNKNIWKEYWLQLAIWIVLALWTLKFLFL